MFALKSDTTSEDPNLFVFCFCLHQVKIIFLNEKKEIDSLLELASRGH